MQKTMQTQGLIPGSGRSPGGGNSHSLQHSCLENPTDRGGWGLSPPGRKVSDRAELRGTVAVSLWPHPEETQGVEMQGPGSVS